MAFEGRTLEQIGDTCVECGATLTRKERLAALESGGPPLCTVHAAEIVPLDEDEAAQPPR